MDVEVVLTVIAVVAPMVAAFLTAMGFLIRWVVKPMIGEVKAEIGTVSAELKAEIAETNAKIAETNAKLDAGLAGVNVRLDALEARFDGLEKRFDRLEDRVDSLSETVEVIARRQAADDAWRHEADRRLARIENRQAEAAAPAAAAEMEPVPAGV